VRFKELSLTAHADAGNATLQRLTQVERACFRIMEGRRGGGSSVPAAPVCKVQETEKGSEKRIYFLCFNFTLLAQNERKLNKLTDSESLSGSFPLCAITISNIKMI